MFIKEAEDLTLRSVLERSTRQYDFLVDSLGVAGGVTQLQDSCYIDPLDAPLPDVLDKKKEDCTSCEA